jgi:putative DNA primase/helicase
MSPTKLSDVFRALPDVHPVPYVHDVWAASCPACGKADALDISTLGDGPTGAACIDCTDGCTPEDVARSMGLDADALRDVVADVRDIPSDVIREGAEVDWVRVAAGEDVDRARAVLQHIRNSGRDIAFTPEAGWYEWAGAAWSQIDDAKMRPFVYEVADLMADAALVMASDAHKIDDEDRCEAAMKKAQTTMRAARRFKRTNFIDAVLKELRSLPGVFVSINDFDTQPDLLGAANGVVDLRSGLLRPYLKEDRITHALAVDYVEGATNPRWERFLGEIFIGENDAPDVQLVDYMSRLTGYGLTGHTTEQIFAVFYGAGSNGKGVFTETLKGVLGQHVRATPFDTFEQKPTGGISNDIAALKGSRIVLASEGEAGKPMAEALIKRLTGGDTISARFMRKEFFEFKPTFLILLSTNHKPSFRGQDTGLWRRVKLIPFTRSFEGDASKDAYLENKLKGADVPASAVRTDDDLGDGPAGILAWAVRGAVAWYADGLQEPARISDETAAFRKESDRLGEFIADNFSLTGEHLDVVREPDVWRRYFAWCADQEERPISKQNFLAMMRGRGGFAQDLRSGGRVFRGVKMLTDPERAAKEQQAIRDDRNVAGLRVVGGDEGFPF